MVRFFEDRGGQGGAIRLLVGITLAGGDEAVRVATVEDTQHYARAYSEYRDGFPPAPAVPCAKIGSRTTDLGGEESSETVDTAVRRIRPPH